MIKLDSIVFEEFNEWEILLLLHIAKQLINDPDRFPSDMDLAVATGFGILKFAETRMGLIAKRALITKSDIEENRIQALSPEFIAIDNINTLFAERKLISEP